MQLLEISNYNFLTSNGKYIGIFCRSNHKKFGERACRFSVSNRKKGPSLRYFSLRYKGKLESMSLPRKIIEQCRLCPAKLWSNADFAQ